MYLDENDQSKVKIDIVMSGSSWVGLGFGATGMAAGTDMLQIDGSSI